MSTVRPPWPRVRCASVVIAAFAVTAADGGEQNPFTEEAIERGIDYTANQGISWGDGITFADLDDDGDPDLITVGSVDGRMGLYQNDGTGFFTDRFDTSGIGIHLFLSCVAPGDYDNDGDLDLYVSRSMLPDVMYRNDGSFHFTDVTAAAGLGDPGEGAGVAWSDYDLDGDLDLYVSTHNFGHPNRFYRNLGDGTFEEIAAQLGVEAIEQETFQASFFDYDRDGDVDLYLTNSYGQHCEDTNRRNLLFQNHGGVFTDVTDEANALACVDAMCIGLGDFDNNGFQDVYVTDNNVPGNALLMNAGFDEFGTCFFVEAAEEWNVESFASGWGSVFFDWDHDGWLDLYVDCAAQPNRFYRHVGAPPAIDLAAAMGVAVTGGASYSCAVADIDGDGDQDLVNCDRGARVRLFINHEGVHDGQTFAWAKFDVVGLGPARWGINAIVDVRTGTTRRFREVVAGSNYKAQNELIAHFGLADATIMNEVVISWPGGTTRQLVNVPINTTWKVFPPDKLGDVDTNGTRDLADFVNLAACHGGAVTEGCEVMDFDGDFDVDMDDVLAFVAVYTGPENDCNDNGVIDLIDIIDGTVSDVNGNGIADACDQLVGDLNDDLFVNGADLRIIFAQWGEAGTPADLDGSGKVDFGDILMVLVNWWD